MSVLSPLIEVYRLILEPIAPFAWFGTPISTLDVVATLRLCIILRQIRDMQAAQHKATKKGIPMEDYSFVKNLATTLLVVYGGEAITGEEGTCRVQPRAHRKRLVTPFNVSI